ncbi:MAG: hypothetical protein WC683_19685 [bacterium]
MAHNREEDGYRQSMSFGVMPTRAAFDLAFSEECESGYEITIPPGNDDLPVLIAAMELAGRRGIKMPETRGIEARDPVRHYRDAVTFDVSQLWALVQALFDLGDGSEIRGCDGEEIAEDQTPEGLASSIMDTLGFEWI